MGTRKAGRPVGVRDGTVIRYARPAGAHAKAPHAKVPHAKAPHAKAPHAKAPHDERVAFSPSG